MRKFFCKKSFYPVKKGMCGFSLLEMSIVLLIIALVVGGLSVGSSMMASTTIRNIAIRAFEYSSAIDTFKQKYQALPGDMPNATQIWGRADDGVPISSNCALPESDISTASPQATCNGDGDRTIGRIAAQTYEVFRAWQQLKNAGIITGTYTGIAGADGVSQELVGQNIPAGEDDGGGYSINYVNDSALPAAYFSGASYGHVIFYGTEVYGNNFARGAAISASNSYNLDKKIDDAVPATGKLRVFNNTTQPNCATTNVATTAVYQRDNEGSLDCTLLFLTGY
jgi:prepilin-type N-terminal cleavage/methylation domain-containing protein